MPSAYRGSCLCNSVEYEITGEPFTFFVCHCNNCKKASGAAFMSNAFFKSNVCILFHESTGCAFLTILIQQVMVLKGSEHIQRYRDNDTASGRAVIRCFCPQCGSNLFLENDNNDFIIVATGTLDDRVDWGNFSLPKNFSRLIIFHCVLAPRREGFPDRKTHWITGINLSPKSKL